MSRAAQRTSPSTSLVTSHFARTLNHSATGRARYTEIEAALVSNLFSSALVEVYVVYDSTTSDDNCTHLRHRLLAHVGKVSTAGRATGEARARLKCISRALGQPSYRRCGTL